MEMLSAFTDVLHVSNLSRPEHIQVKLSESWMSESEMSKSEMSES